MAYGAAADGEMKRPSEKWSGSVKSEWQLANNETKTINTNALRDLDAGSASSYENVIPLGVPNGATRMLMRVTFPDGTDTGFTTASNAPQVYVIGVDANGVPMRLDAGGDADATGTTIPIATTTDYVIDEDDNIWSNPVDLTGLDLQGCETVYVLVSRVSAYTDGSTSQTGQVYVKFLD